MENYDTVVEAIKGLQLQGYTINFNIAFDKLICKETNICLNPNEFEIVQTFRFEGDSNPEDEDIVYAIESKNGNQKGILTSAYGLYADSTSNEMIQKLSTHH